MPANLKEIENTVFEGCCNLTGELIIPSSVETIGKYAFRSCTNFTDAYFYGSVPSAWGSKVFVSNAAHFLIQYSYGSTSKWTFPKWVAPDGTEYNTAAFTFDWKMDVNSDHYVNIADAAYLPVVPAGIRRIVSNI